MFSQGILRENGARRRKVMRMTRLYVNAAGLRPDFRLVLAFVWGNDDCDTDGNSDNPASREWTELYAKNRIRPSELFDVVPTSVDPLVLEVESRQEWLAAAVAYLLAASAGGGVSESAAGPFEPGETLLSRVGELDVATAWERYWASPFQRATLDDPYPNLREM